MSSGGDKNNMMVAKRKGYAPPEGVEGTSDSPSEKPGVKSYIGDLVDSRSRGGFTGTGQGLEDPGAVEQNALMRSRLGGIGNGGVPSSVEGPALSSSSFTPPSTPPGPYERQQKFVPPTNPPGPYQRQGFTPPTTPPGPYERQPTSAPPQYRKGYRPGDRRGPGQY